jgi:hypothetical protein
VKSGTPIGRWGYKVEEARRLATEANLSEFGTILSQLEWHVAKQKRGADSNEDTVRAGITSVFEDNGYSVSDVERDEICCVITAKPKKEEEIYAELLKAANFDGDNCFLRVIVAMRPALSKDECKELDEYIEWWNTLDKYKLTRLKEEKQLRANIDLHAPTTEQLSARFGYFKSLWDVDKMNCISLMLGFISLDECRRAKLKALE